MLAFYFHDPRSIPAESTTAIILKKMFEKNENKRRRFLKGPGSLNLIESKFHIILNNDIILVIKLGLFFVYFQSFQPYTTFFTTNQCEKCPSSIQRLDSNSQPSDQESPPLANRPGLPPKSNPC